MHRVLLLRKGASSEGSCHLGVYQELLARWKGTIFQVLLLAPIDRGAVPVRLCYRRLLHVGVSSGGRCLCSSRRFIYLAPYACVDAAPLL